MEINRTECYSTCVRKKERKWQVSRTAFGIQPQRIDAADGGYLFIHKRSKTCQYFPAGGCRCAHYPPTVPRISALPVYFILQTYSAAASHCCQTLRTLFLQRIIREDVRWLVHTSRFIFGCAVYECKLLTVWNRRSGLVLRSFYENLIYFMFGYVSITMPRFWFIAFYTKLNGGKKYCSWNLVAYGRLRDYKLVAGQAALLLVLGWFMSN